MTIQTTGGRLTNAARISIENQLRRYKDTDTLTITIERTQRKHSDAQRAYWFAVVVPAFADHCGFTKDEAHAELMRNLMPELCETLTGLDGTEIIRRPSYSKLTKQQAAELCDSAYTFAKDFGLTIPEPTKEIGK